tara:strand:+ start:1921 stop:2490 length:570 start_codon:yes stop_codon:yes gene_type:complete
MKEVRQVFNNKFLIFNFIIIFSFGLFSYLANIRRPDLNHKRIKVITEIDFIDSIFSNVLPFIEPASIDHFSYDRKKLIYFLDRFNKIYGYNLIDQNRFYKDCSIVNFRSASLDKCFLNDYWSNLSQKEWRSIANNYKVYNLVSFYELSNLKKCFTYLMIDKQNNSKTYKINHYILPSSINNVKCDYLKF